MNRLYGKLPARDIGPLALKSVRAEMLHPADGRKGWCRTHANRQVGRLKHVFKWAAESEMIPASLYHGLSTVSGLRCNRAEARESEPVRPVPDQFIEAIKPHIAPQLWAMVQFQLLTGARSGEVCRMRTIDIDTGGIGSPVWIYRPREHKSAHHGHAREIRIGPLARQAIAPCLKAKPTAFIFSPADAVALRRAEMRKHRKTPVQPSQRDRSKAKPRKLPGERYTRDSYRAAIVRACLKADRAARAAFIEAHPDRPVPAIFVPSWHPHQLRHNAATNFRRAYDMETARILLGHKTMRVTEQYAEADGTKASMAIAAMG